MSQGRIIVAESDEQERNSLVRFFLMTGYEALPAADGEEAYSLLQEKNPDLLLMNLLLPGKPALDILRGIRENEDWSDIPVIIITEDDSEEISIVVRSNGANDYIVQPVKQADLSIKIQTNLELLDYKRKLKEANRHLEEDKAKLRRYFSQDIVEKILSEDISAELGGVIVDAAIIFFDVRKSTTLAEKIGPARYTKTISELFTGIIDIVESNGGAVNDILGDGLILTFGCPFPGENDAMNAVRCLLAIRSYVEEFNSSRPQYLEDPLGFGMGASVGKLFAGNIGSDQHMKFAVMGDPVNVASRIQDLTKRTESDILISEELKNRVESYVRIGKSFSAVLRGKKNREMIYSLEGMKPDEAVDG